jgi:uncharacterized membrane protein
MNMLLPPGPLLFWLTLIPSLLLLIISVIYAPWRQLAAHQPRQHLLFATVLFLGLFWSMQVSVRGVIAFHPMLMTVVMMVFGWSLALLIGAAALVVLEIYRVAFRSMTLDWDVALRQFDLSTFPVDFCVGVVIPVCWAWAVLWLVNRWRFKNPFTYFLGIGFFGAIISCLLIGLGAFLLFFLTGSEVPLATVQEHFIIFLLMTFPEGFINGALATTLTVLWPDMVKTYRDDWFLRD